MGRRHRLDTPAGGPPAGAPQPSRPPAPPRVAPSGARPGAWARIAPLGARRDHRPPAGEPRSDGTGWHLAVRVDQIGLDSGDVAVDLRPLTDRRRTDLVLARDDLERPVLVVDALDVPRRRRGGSPRP